MTDRILVWPHDSLPEMRSFRLRAFNVSSLTSQTQELIPGGLMVQRWEAKLTMPDMAEERWRDHDGLFADLAGVGGKIRLWDAARMQPYYNIENAQSGAAWDGGAMWEGGEGWATGTLPPFVVAGENRVRGQDNLLLTGFPASLSGVLRRGDLFEIRPNGIPATHGMLHVVTRYANSNSDGHSRVYFKPGLRKGIRAGDQVVIGGGGEKPSSVFRVASDDEGMMDVRAGMIGSFGVSLIEVLPHA